MEKTSKRSLFHRFWPYLKKYRAILIFDLFCAALTTICDMVLPLIMRFLTNTAITDASLLTVSAVLKLGGVYLVLRVIDAAANYYMASRGHIMGVYVETDMRRDAFAHLQKLGYTYYSNTKVGQIMGRITNDLFDVTEFAHHCPEEFFIAAIKITASFIIQRGAHPGFVHLCAADGAGVRQAQPEAARGIPPPAFHDRRAERPH